MGVDLSGGSTPAVPERNQGLLQELLDAVTDVAGFLAGGLTGFVQGAVDLVVGVVTTVVGGVVAVLNAVGSLFGMSSRDMSKVDAARVAAENAIVDNLGEALDQLDEVQRAGGAFMDYELFRLNDGRDAHVLPLSAPMTLQEGTRWVDPAVPLTHSHNNLYFSSQHGLLAQGSGYLELLEPGFWRIDYQASLLQVSNYYADPAEVWCYVSTIDSDRLRYPIGPPGMDQYGNPLQFVDNWRFADGETGQYANGINSHLHINAFGRSSSYVDQIASRWGGSNTIAGTVFALIPSGGYKVTMSASAYRHYGGGVSTFVMATKINSESLRDEIERLKIQIANALPGESAALELSEQDIAAMVAQAEEIEVPDVEVPNDP